MTATNRRAVKALNALIAACKDGEQGYRAAEKAAGEHESLKQLFGSCAEQRARFVAELLAEVHRLDTPVERKGTPQASAHRAWMGVRSVLPHKDARAAIAGCERGERAALKRYEAALKLVLPPETRALVEKQCAALRGTHQQMRDMKVIATLNDLIAACKDGEQGYESAAGDVQKAELKELFHSCARQRAQFAAELEAAVQRLGDAARQKGTFVALLHRGWMKMRGTFTRRDGRTILRECERGERSAVRHFEAALKRDLPPAIRTLVEGHYVKIKEVQARLHGLGTVRKP